MNRIAPLLATIAVALPLGLVQAATTPKPYPLAVGTTPLGQAPVAQADAGDQGAFTPAPMPDEDAASPHYTPLDPTAPRVSPQMVWANGNGSSGDGFTQGSAYTGQVSREFKPGPGVNVSVPLQ